LKNVNNPAADCTIVVKLFVITQNATKITVKCHKFYTSKIQDGGRICTYPLRMYMDHQSLGRDPTVSIHRGGVLNNNNNTRTISNAHTTVITRAWATTVTINVLGGAREWVDYKTL